MAFFSFFKKKKDIKQEDSVENKVAEIKENTEEVSESDSDEEKQKGYSVFTLPVRQKVWRGRSAISHVTFVQ